MNQEYSLFADVSIGIGTKIAFTYAVPEHLVASVAPGKRVVVELRNRQRVGVVMRLSSKCSLPSVKEIASVIDSMPVLSSRMMKLIEWVAEYYLAPIGSVVEAAIPRGLDDIAPGYRDETQSKRRRGKPPINVAALASVSEFCTDGWEFDLELKLNEEQKAALARIIAAADAKDPKPILLHGVTGSGKTEVFLRAAEHVIRKGRRALVLVPEISLTPALLSLLAHRFGERAGVFHSKLTPAQRRDQWERAHSGEVDIVIGVRSAVFAPLSKLGLIVVDEEHETTYKQGGSPFYNARDVAVMSASIHACPVVLSGATPSLETFYNSSRGKYEHIFLSKRVDSRPMAEVSMLDLRQRQIVAPSVLTLEAREAISKTLAAGEQVLLFMNVRGFSSFLTCSKCGYVFRCDHCDITLTHHSARDSLVCHLCGNSRRVPRQCDSCHSEKIVSFGFGTERVEDEAARIFPDAKILRMDSDAISTRKKYESALTAITRGDVDIIVGTQITAKGHNFPHLTLAVVVLADIILNLPDFRAAERTFQLLTQVCGRPGRHGKQGKVLLQTYSPEHCAIKAAAAQDYALFFEQEMKFRKKLGLPPLTRLASILITGRDQDKTMVAAELVGELLRSGLTEDISILGPAEAPIAKLKDRFRFQAFARSYNSKRLHAYLHHKLKEFEKAKLGSGGVRISVDIDPVSML
ncbi:MAG: primosomal protein N' [Candidatus Coatesbacteria bacterium]|nr:primosomal protein N' [Candidatus Coatesbacteria bacterium]